jgi:hypothetical protein
MSYDADDNGCEPIVLSEENRLSVWAGEGGYVPPACEERADEPESVG